jgi:pimeloyl-ACP methyl ester carboxylesterase
VDWRRYRRPGALADLGDVTLWYDEEAGGEPLVLLGGFGAGHFIWDFVWPLLPEYRRVTLEPRGLGRSDRPPGVADMASKRGSMSASPDVSDLGGSAPGPYGVEVWADDVRRLLDHLGIERTHVWATGFGNYYATRFVADHPDRVGAFVAYTDVWAGDPAKGYDKIWKVYGTIIDTYGTTGRGAQLLTSMFSVPWLPWFPEWEAANLSETMHPDTAAATAGYCLTEADVRADLERIAVPTLVLQGDHGWDGQPLAESDDPSLTLMRERIPHLDVVTIPGSHPAYVIAHKPAECAAVVREFLGRKAA